MVNSSSFPRLVGETPGTIAALATSLLEAKPTAPRSRAPAVPLSTLEPGQTGVVCETIMDPADAALLRAMGLRPNALIRVRRAGEPCIVEVVPCGGEGGAECHCAGRIGLAKLLASRVLVARLTSISRHAAE